MESQPQNPELRIDPENSHPCKQACIQFPHEANTVEPR